LNDTKGMQLLEPGTSV